MPFIIHAMGRLISIDDARKIPEWYFSDTYYSHGGGNSRWMFSWPSKDFPHLNTIHQEHLTQEHRPRLRRWIDNNITDTVIYDTVDHSYRIFYGGEGNWEHSYEVRNLWYRFFFEDANTALTFKLAFSDLIKDITPHHPGRPEDEERCSKRPGERI